MDRYVESAPEDPDAPGAFRFASPGKLAAILAEAGADQIIERKVSFKIEAPIRVEQFWTLRVELSDTLRDRVHKLAPATLSLIEHEVGEAAQEYFAGGIMSFPAHALVVSATKS